MAEIKRFYWIRLKDKFMTSDTVDFLMSQKNGANYVVLYQMLCLKCINTNGELKRQIGEIIIPYDVHKIQRDCKYFDLDTVIIALGLYKQLGLIYEQEDGFLKIADFDNLIGYGGGKNETTYTALPAKSNAERQRSFRAKVACEKQQHVPLIEDHLNQKRYNGNYYLVMRRDNYKCRICGSIENLCVHHIDGYDAGHPENSAENKMLVLCRHCHSNVHAGVPISQDILNEIDYYFDDSNDSNVTNIVTQECLEKENRERYKKENTPCGGTKEKATRFSPPTLEDVQKYCQERKNNVDATRFWNFYESKGWLVGKNKMKDWKAAVRTWEQEDKQKSTVSKPQRQSDHTERVYSADELNSIVKSIGTLSEEDL